MNKKSIYNFNSILILIYLVTYWLSAMKYNQLFSLGDYRKLKNTIN